MFTKRLLNPKSSIARSLGNNYNRQLLILGSVRAISSSNSHGKHEGLPGHNDEHQGTFSRTDKEVVIEHPPEEEFPRSVPYQGRGGVHNRRTLAAFSLEDRVGVVTGGARGLGLIMAQALVISGADVALVDLNSKPTSSTLLARSQLTRGVL